MLLVLTPFVIDYWRIVPKIDSFIELTLILHTASLWGRVSPPTRYILRKDYVACLLSVNLDTCQCD